MSNDKASSAVAEPESAPSEPTAAHRALDVFVGEWNTTGTVIGGDGGVLRAVDRYEWFPGRFFLLHHVEGELAGQEMKALEIIGYDDERGDYFSYSFDNGGRAPAYRARLDGTAWSIDGETERFRGELTSDGRVLRGLWEQQADGGAWRPWLRIELRKVK